MTWSIQASSLQGSVLDRQKETRHETSPFGAYGHRTVFLSLCYADRLFGVNPRFNVRERWGQEEQSELLGVHRLVPAPHLYRHQKTQGSAPIASGPVR